MTALYKEGRNQETCKMIRDHKDHIPAAGQASKPRCGLSIHLMVLNLYSFIQSIKFEETVTVINEKTIRIMGI